MKKVKQKFRSKFLQLNFQLLSPIKLRRKKEGRKGKDTKDNEVKSGHNVYLTAYLHCSWTTNTLCLDKTLHSSDKVVKA